MQEAQGLFDILIVIMIQGLPTTLALTIAALLFGFLVGIGLALARVYGPKELQWVSLGYEKLLRGIPLLILLFIFGIGLSGLFAWAGSGYNSLFAAAVVALGLRSAAYQSEIFRGGIMSIDPGQMMAAQAIGMNTKQSTRHIILPQALRLSIPGWTNEYAVVIKDTSLVLAIGVHEILYQMRGFYWTYPALFFEIMLIVTFIYLLFTYPITKYVGESMTKKLRQLGLGGGQ